MNFLVEVHSRDRQVEFYLTLGCKDEKEARRRIQDHYIERGLGILSDFDAMATNPGVRYYIFEVTELPEDQPVIYLTGEYRSKFPL